MDYKKDKLYKVGFILAAAAVVDLVLGLMFMGLGFDSAIIWFFAGCPVLVVGCWLMQVAKTRYLDYIEGSPTAFDRFMDKIYTVKEFFVRKGAVGSILFILLMASFICSAVSVFKTATAAYNYSGAMNSGYRFNLSESERYYELAAEALENNDERYAERCTLLAEKHLEDSESYYEAALRLKPERDRLVKIMYVVLGVNVGVLAAYIIAVSVHKRNAGDRAS